MRIRRIKKSDLNTCIRIFVKEWAKKPYSEKWTKKTACLRLKEIFEVSPKSCLCVMEKKEIIGFVFSRIFTWFDGKHANIEEMTIDGQYQGRGVGKKLLSELEKIFKKNKVVQTELISKRKTRAHKFFRKFKYNFCDWDYLIKRI